MRKSKASFVIAFMLLFMQGCASTDYSIEGKLSRHEKESRKKNNGQTDSDIIANALKQGKSVLISAPVEGNYWKRIGSETPVSFVDGRNQLQNEYKYAILEPGLYSLSGTIGTFDVKVGWDILPTLLQKEKFISSLGTVAIKGEVGYIPYQDKEWRGRLTHQETVCIDLWTDGCRQYQSQTVVDQYEGWYPVTKLKEEKYTSYIASLNAVALGKPRFASINLAPGELILTGKIGTDITSLDNNKCTTANQSILHFECPLTERVIVLYMPLIDPQGFKTTLRTSLQAELIAQIKYRDIIVEGQFVDRRTYTFDKSTYTMDKYEVAE